MTCATRKTASSSVTATCYQVVCRSVRSTFQIHVDSSVPRFCPCTLFTAFISPVLSSESRLLLVPYLKSQNRLLDYTYGFSRSSQVVHSCMFHVASRKFSRANSYYQVLRPMAPFLLASTITFYLVSKMQDMGVHCMLHLFSTFT